MFVRGKSGRVLSGALCGALLSAAANAADLGRPMPVKAIATPASAWAFSFTSYFWAPSTNGTSTIKGRSLDIDQSFIDLIKNAQIPKDVFGLMGTFEARKDRWSLYTDLVYMRLAQSREGVRARSVHPSVGGTLAASADVTIQMFFAELGAGYELFRTGPSVGTTGPATAFDVYGGGRVWWQQAEANLAVTAGLTIGDLTVSGGRALAKSPNVSWVDPFVGARVRHRFSPSTELIVKGDIGGFGVGSRLTWQAIGTINWDFAKTKSALWTAVVGYRALYTDYSRGDGATLYEYDILMYGPVFGVTARF